MNFAQNCTLAWTKEWNCQISSSMVDSYLCEFMWRQQQNKGKDLFEEISNRIAKYTPLRWIFSLKVCVWGGGERGGLGKRGESVCGRETDHKPKRGQQRTSEQQTACPTAEADFSAPSSLWQTTTSCWVHRRTQMHIRQPGLPFNKHTTVTRTCTSSSTHITLLATTSKCCDGRETRSLHRCWIWFRTSMKSRTYSRYFESKLSLNSRTKNWQIAEFNSIFQVYIQKQQLFDDFGVQILAVWSDNIWKLE